MIIYCMSIREPHASLFLCGKKHFETRNRRTKYRGIIYIQSAFNFGDDDELNKELIAELGYVPETCGYIIFKAELTDCIPITEEFKATLSETELKNGYYDRKYVYKLENIEPVNPFRVKGLPSVPFKVDVEESYL